MPRGGGLETKRRLTFLCELTQLGYTLRNPEALEMAGGLGDYSRMMQALRALRGGDVPYVPLFSRFPDEVPDDDAYFAARITGVLGNLLGTLRDGRTLDNGLKVPDWLFDLSAFGADPITQMQDEGLFESATRRKAQAGGDRHVEWRRLEVIFEDELEARLKDFLQRNLYASSSIKEALHEDLGRLLDQLGADAVDMDRIVRKEALALVLGAAWRAGYEALIRRHAKTPTDVLRLFAALTGTDVSLAKPVRFPKLRRAQRRLVLEVLEGAPALQEDLLRYRGLWLQIGRSLHVSEHTKRFPRAAEAFDALRNGRPRSFAATTEGLLADREAERLLGHLSSRPGVLARKLHELLRKLPAARARVLEVFAGHAPEMPLKNLLVLERYFATIDALEHRTVVNKRGTIRVLANTSQGSLPTRTLSSLATILDEAMRAQLAARESWADRRVWSDPALDEVLVPLQQRAASDGLITLARGSRIPARFDRVLRLFIYWKQTEHTTDLDLSLIQLDADFGYCGHVSYTNLKADGIAHSGDIQSAPRGAAEFIDVSLDAVAPPTRYLVAQVHRFSGERFADMRCHAGWMVRQDVDASLKTFDIKTVANKLDLTGHTSFCVPMMVDLEARKVILTDLYMGSGTLGSNVEGSHHVVALACREVARFEQTRPALGALVQRHVSARGGRRVEDRAEADLSFGLGPDCDLDLSRPEVVLSELL